MQHTRNPESRNGRLHARLVVLRFWVAFCSPLIGDGKWGGKTYRAFFWGSESGIGLVCARSLKGNDRA